MGNYLQSLRAPPREPAEERNHPLYYDWSLPKWSLYRESQQGGGQGGHLTSPHDANDPLSGSRAATPAANGSKQGQSGGEGLFSLGALQEAADKRARGQSASRRPINSDQTAKEASRASLKNALMRQTSGSDIAAKRRTSSGGEPMPDESKRATTRTDKSAAVTPAGGTTTTTAGSDKSQAIKQVAGRQQQTIDPLRPQGVRLDEDRANKAAANIHTVPSRA